MGIEPHVDEFCTARLPLCKPIAAKNGSGRSRLQLKRFRNLWKRLQLNPLPCSHVALAGLTSWRRRTPGRSCTPWRRWMQSSAALFLSQCNSCNATFHPGPQYERATTRSVAGARLLFSRRNDGKRRAARVVARYRKPNSQRTMITGIGIPISHKMHPRPIRETLSDGSHQPSLPGEDRGRQSPEHSCSRKSFTHAGIGVMLRK